MNLAAFSDKRSASVQGVSRVHGLSFQRIAAVFLLCLVAAFLLGRPVSGQAGPPKEVTVQLLEPIDSAQGQEGQRYRATIAKETTIAGMTLAKGSPATVALVAGTGGSRWTLKLIEITMNNKLFRVNGQNPAVVPTSARDFLTMSRKTVTTRDRIAVAAGENIRFVLGAAQPQTPAQAPAGVASSPAAQRSSVPSTTAVQDPSAALRSQKVPGPPPGQYAHIGRFGDVLSDKDANIEVRLDHCDRQATASSSCDVSVMNLGKPIVLSPAIGGFAIFDSKGQGIGLRESKCCGGRNFGTYLAGNVTHAHYTYDGLDPDVKSLARVSIKFFFTGSGRYTEYEFRDVPLGQVAKAAFTPTPLAPATSVVEEQGWRFSVVRCSPLAVATDHDGQGVQCFFKLENLKADRGVDLHGPSFVDSEGRTYDASWYYGPYSFGFIGDSATYARTSAVPYLNRDVLGYGLAAEEGGKSGREPDIKYGEPRYLWATFAGVPKDVKHIVQLDLGIAWGPNTFLQGTFRDIDLTPMPHVAAPAAARKTK
jgi:hypothetical protein